MGLTVNYILAHATQNVTPDNAQARPHKIASDVSKPQNMTPMATASADRTIKESHARLILEYVWTIAPCALIVVIAIHVTILMYFLNRIRPVFAQPDGLVIIVRVI